MPTLHELADRHVIVDKREHHYLSFPDIGVAADGRLVLVYREADQHVATRRKLLARTSRDAGRTWSAVALLNAAGGHCPRITRLSDGQLVVIDDDPPTLYWSVDNTQSWLRQPAPAFTHGIIDRLLELDTETLLAAAQWSKGSHPHPTMGQPPIEQMIYISRNRGASFSPLCPIPAAPHLALCEASLAKLADGRIMALLRENSRVFEPMYVTYSHDLGRTWSDPWPTPLIGHRPCLGQTRSGKLLVTYRNVGPDMGTAAWLGAPDELGPPKGFGERLESNGFQVHSSIHPATAATLDAEGLHIRIPEEAKNLAAYYALRPLSDPAHAIATLEAEVRVFEAQANHCGLRLGFWWRVFPDRVVPERRGARPVDIPTGRSNLLRLEYGQGQVTLYVNDRKRRTYALDCESVNSRPVVFGTVGGRPNNAGLSQWRRLRLDIREPRLLRRTSWSWTPDAGLPDSWAQRRVLELKNDCQASAGDFGYSGWVENEDGCFVCAHHHADSGSPGYRRGYSSHILVTRFFETDFQLRTP